MPSAPTKNHTGYVVLFGTILVVGVILGFLGWQRGWLFGGPRYVTPIFNPRYLPPDTAAVIHVDMRELRESKGVNKELGPPLRKLLNEMAPSDLRTALAIDPEQDIDWMQLTLHPGEKESHPVDMTLLIAGNFDPAKFKLDPKGFHQINQPGDRYRLYELPDDRLPQPLTLTPGEHAVLLSDQPARISKMLTDYAEGKQAEGKEPVLEDETLALQFQKLDRKQTIWGVASLTKLRQGRPLPPFANSVLEHYLRPILDKTDLIYGGISCGTVIDGTIDFQTSSDENALALETYLREQSLTAKAFYNGAKLFGSKNEYLPLLQLLGSGEVKRRGRLVSLHCHLP